MNDRHIIVDNQFVSEKVERVVLAIKEYEPLIDVEWIPFQKRSKDVAAFKVIYHDPNGPPITLFTVKDESEFDERVLMLIIANDNRNGAPTLNDYEAWEEACKRVEKQKWLDQLEEMNDIAAHILKTPLNTYKVNNDLTIKSGIPFNANNVKG